VLVSVEVLSLLAVVAVVAVVGVVGVVAAGIVPWGTVISGVES
jgi:hypothetical protein